MVPHILKNIILILIFFFLIQEKREIVVKSNSEERKSPLTSCLTMKNIDFDVDEFLSIKEFSPRCFLPFFFLKMVDLSSISFLLQVDFGF